MLHRGKSSLNDSRKEESEKQPKKKKEKSFSNTSGAFKKGNIVVKIQNSEGIQIGDKFHRCSFPNQKCHNFFHNKTSEADNECTATEEIQEETEKTNKTDNVIKKCDEKSDVSMLRLVADDARMRREKLCQECASWNTKTLKTIKCLQTIHDHLNNSFNSKYVVFSRIATFGASIIGMAGVVLTVVPSNLLRMSLIFGGTSVATITRIGSFINYHYQCNQLCENAKEKFEDNIKCTKRIEELKSDYFQFLKQTEDKLNQLKERDPEVEQYLKEIFNDLKLNGMFPSVHHMENMGPIEKILDRKMIMFVCAEKLITLIRNTSINNAINNIKILVEECLPTKYHKLTFFFLLLIQAPSIENGIRCIVMLRKEIGRLAFTEIEINRFFNEIGKPMKISLCILNAAFFFWEMGDLIKTSIIKYRETEQSREIADTVNNLQTYQQEVKNNLEGKFKGNSC